MNHLVSSGEVYCEFEVDGKQHRDFCPEQALAILLIEQVIFTNNYWYKDWPWEAKQKTNLFVNCGDTFGYACADGEGIDYSELESLWQHYEKDNVMGPIVWCIKRRRQLPIQPVLDRLVKDGIWDIGELNFK